MKNAVLWIIFMLAIVVAVCGLYMIFYGSFEMFPTKEQFEKTQIAGWILLLSGASVDGIIAACMMKRRKM